MDLKNYLDTPAWEWPKDAGRTFAQTLADRGASKGDRLIAAQLAGDPVVINDDLAGVLMSVVNNASEPEELRAKAAISFGPALELADEDEFDDLDGAPISEKVYREIQQLLKAIHADENNPKLVRRKVLEASVRGSGAWHHDAVFKACTSGDRDWMLTAVFCMIYVKGFEKQILGALDSKDLEIHVEAVTAAGTWELDDAWEHVSKLVEDPNTPKSLLLAAIGAVAWIRPMESSDLLTPLTDSADEDISDAAEEALSEAGYTSHPFNEDALDENGDWVN